MLKHLKFKFRLSDLFSVLFFWLFLFLGWGLKMGVTYGTRLKTRTSWPTKVQLLIQRSDKNFSLSCSRRFDCKALHVFLSRKLHFGCKPNSLQATNNPPGWVKLPPLQSMTCRVLEGMMVVMPSLSKSKQCYPPENIDQNILLDDESNACDKSSRNQSKVCCKPASKAA